MADDTICCIAVLDAREGADKPTLQSAWLSHDPIGALAPGARYRRSFPLASEERGFRLRGTYAIAQIWVDGIGAATELCRAIAGLVIPGAQQRVMATREVVVIDGPERRGGEDGVKGWYFSTRKTGMSIADFQAHWRDVHGPLVVPSPGISRYVQFYPCPETYGGPLHPKYDSLAELTFPDKAAQAEFSVSEHNTVNQRNDLPNLWDMTGGALRFYLADHDERAAVG